MRKLEQQLEREVRELKCHVANLKEKIKMGWEVDMNELIITEDLIELKLEDIYGEIQ